jgi:hypothetical protein
VIDVGPVQDLDAVDADRDVAYDHAGPILRHIAGGLEEGDRAGESIRPVVDDPYHGCVARRLDARRLINPRDEVMARHWMKGAVKHPGALRATAKRIGLIKGDEKLTLADVGKLKRSSDATTRRRATLAETFMHAHKG